jgi:hypothetical protein
LNCSIGILTADSTTLFGHTVPAVGTIIEVSPGGATQHLRDPRVIDQWLLDHRVQPGAPGDLDLPLVKYFDRLCRKFARQHQIRDSENDSASFLIRHQFWDEIRQLVGANRLVTESKREMGGPRDAFYRMVRPEDLLVPPAGDAESRAIRDRIVARARALNG